MTSARTDSIFGLAGYNRKLLIPLPQFTMSQEQLLIADNMVKSIFSGNSCVKNAFREYESFYLPQANEKSMTRDQTNQDIFDDQLKENHHGQINISRNQQMASEAILKKIASGSSDVKKGFYDYKQYVLHNQSQKKFHRKKTPLPDFPLSDTCQRIPQAFHVFSTKKTACSGANDDNNTHGHIKK